MQNLFFRLIGYTAIYGGTLLFYGLVIAVVSILNGIVLSILWGWFVVPTFHIPPLSIPAAIGMALIIRYLTLIYKDFTPKVEKEEYESLKWTKEDWKPIVQPIFVLLFGWVVQLFL